MGDIEKIHLYIIWVVGFVVLTFIPDTYNTFIAIFVACVYSLLFFIIVQMKVEK